MIAGAALSLVICDWMIREVQMQRVSPLQRETRLESITKAFFLQDLIRLFFKPCVAANNLSADWIFSVHSSASTYPFVSLFGESSEVYAQEANP